ncbi:beta-galactosidase [Paractinoplanes atraurantiacus]|uniref:Beta-galactosidase n=1 Tax=Paractinoplanes atraurantiacus TaxID=1036182 RepID=A0A285JR82_9ACTN|nr:beta-galactosidase [Actinoplanes atraurantiacus]SNY62824.1 beta-galactosidase [Actinoplanes atraurantiacus]
MPIWYGGDYNPEQWPREVWDEDASLMRTAGVNLATVGVFSWSRLEPRDGEFDFEWLDVVLEKLHAAGVRADLATATASPPPWLTLKHPEILPVTASGVRLSTGSRQQYCPSSPLYRGYATRLVTALAERYGSHPALEMWHINNEYGCHVSRCYCDVSAGAFRSWLRDKYGTVDGLNDAWGTAFWSQTYSSFDEVFPPRDAPTFKNPAQLLDFDRFGSHELLECFRAEAAILRAATPDIPLTTNFMGFFKPANYWEWAKELDFVSDDSYPDPADDTAYLQSAMTRDLMRSLAGDKPWVLMEQAPSAVNWRPQNAAKSPGQMRAWSYQAIAREARGIMYFQWRQSIAGAEQFHSGMVPHSGTDTRVWREIVDFGAELKALSGVLPSTVAAPPVEAAIVLEWESWWALEQAARPTRLSYAAQISAWYKAFAQAGLRVRFVHPGADLGSYRVVVAPTLFLASEADLENLGAYARDGGTLIVTFQSGIVDENLRVRPGGYLGPLQRTLGLWIEEFTPLAVRPAALAGTVTSSSATWSEVVRLNGATVESEFTDGPAAGGPAITSNGTAWYVAADLAADGKAALVETILARLGLDLPRPVPGVEHITSQSDTYVINHNPLPYVVELDGTDLLTGKPARGLELPQYGVAIVRP